MRVRSEPDPAAARARASARSFGETLARIRGEGRREAVGHAERRSGAVADDRANAGARSEGASHSDEPSTERDGTPAPPGHAARSEGRDGEAGVAAGAADVAHGASDAPVSLPPLRELVRALPPAIDAGRLRDGQPLELSFGTSLKVDLRLGREGVEVTLRPDARLTRAAAAELPGLVRALSTRGVRVARALVGPTLERSDPGREVVR
jgi:hypothetical protein